MGTSTTDSSGVVSSVAGSREAVQSRDSVKTEKELSAAEPKVGGAKGRGMLYVGEL